MIECEDQLREMVSHLPIFGGTEQPETCRQCGTRTDFDEVTDQQQLHQCGWCGKQYLVEFDD